MSDKTLILVGAAALGFYLLSTQRNAQRSAVRSVPQYQVPGVNAVGQPAYPTAPTARGASEAASYAQIGGMVGGILTKVFGRIGGPTEAAAMPAVQSIIPDDYLAANPFGMADPYAYEQQAWDNAFSF